MAQQKINPYDPNSPVKPHHFAGRTEQIAEIRKALAAAREGSPVSLFLKGDWGIGKTSILIKLEPEFSEHGLVIREELKEASAPAQSKAFISALLQGLENVVKPVINPLSGDAGVWLNSRINYEHSHTYRGLLQRLLSDYRKNNEGMVAIIVLDNLERAKEEFLHDVKDVFQRIGEDTPFFLLVFAGKSLPGEGEKANDPISRFFRTIAVDPMTDADALETIQKPIKMDPDFIIREEAARWIQDRAAGHPFFLKQICHEVYDIAGGEGDIDTDWIESHWRDIEGRLRKKRFSNEIDNLPNSELQTLLRGSLCGQRFARSAVADPSKGPTIDTALRRLSKERNLIRQVSRGKYEFYHPLFHAFVRSRAEEQGIHMPNIPERSLEELIDLGESDQVEFKETLEYDIWTEKKSPNLVETVLKTIAAFHNSEGGSLLIGVADDGTIMGIDRDLSLLSKGKQSRDGFTLKVQNKIRDQLTPRKERRVRVRFENCSGKDVCIIDVCRLPFITYFNDVLFVRDGPETLQLRGEAMERYLKERNAFDGD
jgi:hypothetical protein